MGKFISLLFKAAFLLLFIAIGLSACNHHSSHHCSDNLPFAESLDTIALFTPSPAMANNYEGMTLIPAGEFMMGAESYDSIAMADELPNHKVKLNAFWMDATEVTNKQFADFVKSTGYINTAERDKGGNAVFMPQFYVAESPLSWWKIIEGVDWQHPLGPGSSIDTMGDYPVVQVSWYDAMAYAHWAGKRLPTEAEWEYAARGGLIGQLYPWGNGNPEKEKHANVFEGKFPVSNTAVDGFKELAPVTSYAANGYGLYNMSGNVWEWCNDKYHSAYYAYCMQNDITKPEGPAKSYDAENRFKELRVIRGGSFMCNSSYCSGYRVSARNKTSPATGLSNVGFRCVRDSL